MGLVDMSNVVSPGNIAAALTEHWSPRVVAELDDSFVKVAKLHGSLMWHSHDNEDELFYVLKGSLRIEMQDRTVELRQGDAFVVPRRAFAIIRLPNKSVTSCSSNEKPRCTQAPRSPTEHALWLSNCAPYEVLDKREA